MTVAGILPVHLLILVGDESSARCDDAPGRAGWRDDLGGLGVSQFVGAAVITACLAADSINAEA